VTNEEGEVAAQKPITLRNIAGTVRRLLDTEQNPS